MSRKRIQKELDEITRHPVENITAGLVSEDDPFLWTATIIGPAGTPYEGGIFNLWIHLPKDYPFKPPRIVFLTKIYHPNISDLGSICTCIYEEEWSPVKTIADVLMIVQSLLVHPIENHMAGHDIAHEFDTDRLSFQINAQTCTRTYAMD